MFFGKEAHSIMYGTHEIPISPSVTSILGEHTYIADTRMLTWESEALSLVVLPKDWEFATGRLLRSVLLIQLKISSSGILATTYLEAEEYGWGKTENEAITEVLTSLVEYMESLETRRDHLGEPAQADLKRLRQLFQPEG